MQRKKANEPQVKEKPRVYLTFTPEQQNAYASLVIKQRLYIDYRGQGYSKSQSYRMAGYDGKNAGQAAYMLEDRNAVIKELVTVLQNEKKTRLDNAESALNKHIDALAQQQTAEQLLDEIKNIDGETAKRIKFYRDIMNGKIKTTKVTSVMSPDGKIKGKKVEETSDVETRMRARKELDHILGLNVVVDMGSLQMGDITIKIVDASKKDDSSEPREVIKINAADEPEEAEEVILDGEKDNEEKDFN